MKQIGGENTPRIGYVLRLFERTTNVISIHIIYYRYCSIRLVDLFFQNCAKNKNELYYFVNICIYIYLFMHGCMYVLYVYLHYCNRILLISCIIVTVGSGSSLLAHILFCVYDVRIGEGIAFLPLVVPSVLMYRHLFVLQQ